MHLQKKKWLTYFYINKKKKQFLPYKAYKATSTVLETTSKNNCSYKFQARQTAKIFKLLHKNTGNSS